MENIISPFTESEKEALSRLASKIAERNGVTQQYVRSLINGTRAVNSKKAKAIVVDLKETAKFLTRPAVPPPPATVPRSRHVVSTPRRDQQLSHWLHGWLNNSLNKKS